MIIIKTNMMIHDDLNDVSHPPSLDDHHDCDEDDDDVADPPSLYGDYQ